MLPLPVRIAGTRRILISPKTPQSACNVLRFDRSTYQYKSRRSDPASLKARIKEICETRVRYGYRRVHYVLRREG